ncbi:E3 ubiquitin-protein ligase TRIM71-like [Stylophora pistillata]|nr:E3 ubiquitin-protein ligase TRIM71-like [Stylophora pistillata]
MKSKKTLEERFDDLSKTTVPALQVGSFVKFISTFSIENLSPGFVTTSEIDTRLWTIEGLTENLQAGLKAEFLICPKSKSEEELTNRGQSKSDVKVLIEPAEDVASLINNVNGEENFQVKFVPKVPGTYSITVKINGDKLVTSPLRVYVKERRIDVVGELVLKGEIPKESNGIAVNSEGTIAVSDIEKHCILIFDKDGNFVRKCGCHGQLKEPAGVTFLNNDELLVLDEKNHCIQQFNVQTGNFVKSFGKEGTGDGEFQSPQGICVNDKGHIVVVDLSHIRIQVLNKDGTFMFKFGDNAHGKLDTPSGCIYHKNKFIVSDIENHCLKVFDSSGKFLYKFGEEGEADGQFSFPWGLCIEKYGDHHSLLVCDFSNGRIQQFTMEGRFVGKTVTTLGNPKAIATTPDGRILVCNCSDGKIYFLK